jgi:S1-C subfamily serine protease
MFLLFWSSTVSADIYRCVDSNGVVHFSDKARNDIHEKCTLYTKEDSKPPAYPTVPTKEDYTQLRAKVRDVSDLLERATVFLVAVNANGKDARAGTGFFVAPGIILTNGHVIGGNNAKVFVINNALGQTLPAQIVAISSNLKRDYALLRIDKPASGYPLYLAFSTDARRTDRIGAWGFPDVVIKNDPMFAAFVEGEIRSAPEVVYSEGVISTIQKHDPPLIVHTAIVSHGNSGGPLVNANGHVLGINTSVTVDGQTYRQAGIAISASDIINYLRENGISPTIMADFR